MKRTCLLIGIMSVGLTNSAFAQEGPGKVVKYLYRKTPQAALDIHVHFPPDWKPGDRRSAIVFFFGGGWRSGRIQQFEKQATYLAKRGMIAARADYRVLSRHKTGPDKCVEDCKNAVRWLRQHCKKLGVDPKRIAAGGGSAGGHTAAATAICPGFEGKEKSSVSSKPNLLILFNPVMDTVFVKRMKPKLAEQLSPNHQLTKECPPTIIFFGTEDRLLVTATDFMKLAAKLDIEAELWTAKGQKHGFFNRSPWMERTLFLADQFLARHRYVEGSPRIQPPDGTEMERTATAK